MSGFDELVEETSGRTWLRNRRGAVVGVLVLVLLVSGSFWGWSGLRDGDGRAHRFDTGDGSAAAPGPGVGGVGGPVVPGQPLVLPPVEPTDDGDAEPIGLVPDLVGSDQWTVRRLLGIEGLGLEGLYGDKYPVCESDWTAEAFQQEIGAGTSTEGLTEVRVWFSRTHADGTVTVPEVDAFTLAAARAALEDHGFEPVVPDGIPEDALVSGQEPAGCDLAAPRTQVLLEFSEESES